jgi:MFS transporter, ACDE family, multidrug resistance protein
MNHGEQRGQRALRVKRTELTNGCFRRILRDSHTPIKPSVTRGPEQGRCYNRVRAARRADSGGQLSQGQETLSQWQIAPFHLGAAIGPMGGGALPIIFAILMGAFDFDRATLSLALPAYMLPYALVQIVSGSISDLTSRRSSILIGFSAYGACTMLAGLSWSFEIFILSQILQGATNAFTTPLLMATLGDVMPRERTGRTMGMFSTLNMAGASGAPLLAGLLAGTSWRLVYIIVGLIAWGLAIWYFAWFRRYGHLVPNRPRAATFRADLAKIWQAVGLTLFLLAALSFLANGAMRGPSYLFAEFMRDAWSTGVGFSGLALGMYGIAGLIMGPLAGLIVERIGIFRGAALSMTGVAFALVLLAVAPGEYWFAAGNFLLGAFAIAAWASLNTLVVQAMPTHRGTAASIFGSTKFLAQAVSPVWFTPLYDTVDPAAIFYVAALMAILLLLPLAILRSRPEQGNSPAAG